MCKGTNCRVNGVRDIFISDDVCEGMKGSSGDESVQGVGISGEHPATCPCRQCCQCTVPVPVPEPTTRHPSTVSHPSTRASTFVHRSTHCLTWNQQQGIRKKNPTPTVNLQTPLTFVYSQLAEPRRRHPLLILIIAPPHCVQC